ncbi:N-acetyltransferase [Pichia kluyveri]|uniref:N-acetyltransferase n=1 Tax=Pichia kluyveri TaxID=36015 RepID=A0AAV5QY58_PICKL|nr:N-acetyltransferase [Pichia kluyveri]
MLLVGVSDSLPENTVQCSRGFTPFEKYYFWRNKLNMYSNFRVAVEYTEELDIDAIYYALKEMVKEHSSLSMNAYKKKHYIPWLQFPYYLKFMDKYKLNDVLKIVNDDSLSVTNIFNDLQNVHFKYSTDEPLWSLILLNKKTLVYYSDHLLFDGSSGLNFHRVFSKYFSEYNEKKKYLNHKICSIDDRMNNILFDIDNDSNTLNLAPKPSDLIDYSIPLVYLLYVIMLICFPKSLINLIKYYFIDDGDISKSRTYNMISLSKKMIQLNNNKDHCKLVHISQEKLQTLISDCRKYKVKLTSLLVVMSLLSISQITGDEKDTMVVIPVNSRDKIKDEKVKKDFGLYLGDLNLELPPVTKMCRNGQINWSFVKYINDYIHNSFANSQRDLGLTSLVDTKIFLEQRKQCYDNSMIGTLLVSNLGNLKESQKNQRVIEKPNDDVELFENAYFDQPCQSAVLSLFTMNVISTPKGGANLALHSVNSKWLDIFNEGVNQQLSQF